MIKSNVPSKPISVITLSVHAWELTFILKIRLVITAILNDLSLKHAEITMSMATKLTFQLIHVTITSAVITLLVHSTLNVMTNTKLSDLWEYNDLLQ